MPEPQLESTSHRSTRYATYVFALIGAWFGIALIKFGNPIVFDGMFPPPRGLIQIIFLQWPANWGFVGTVLLCLLAIPLLRFPKCVPRWVVVLPAAWLLWQWIATFDSIEPNLSRLTTLHFTIVAACFYLGLFASAGLQRGLPLWVGIGVGMALVIASGFQQQFGGLEANAEFYEKLANNQHPADIQQAFDTPEFRSMWDTPSFRKKILSKRIYATLFYPNTLAGVIILLTPGLLAAAWFGLKNASPVSRKALPILIGLGAVLCLVWSGSKAGWLIAMAMTGIILLRSAIPKKWRKLIVLGFVILGLALLVGRNLDYFQRGATSVGARVVYWTAAANTFLENPITGAGPGTFAIYYAEQKSTEDEMARLAHNDFIQQASDSGAIGFLTFLAFVAGSIILLYRTNLLASDPIAFFIWLGLFGWGLQSLTEFGLYIPAIAWPAFFLLGVLWRETSNAIDTPEPTR